MSFLSWFSRSPSKGAPTRKPSSHPSPTAAAAATAAQPRAPKVADQAEQLARKNVRMERREALYMVVRDAMVRAGVLSAGYKFKVLSLDPQGLQFVVMIDLAREYGSSTARLGEIESLIIQSAKTRFEILVTAVYWRMHDNSAVGLHMRRATDKESGPATASGTPNTIRAPIMPVGSYEARASAPAPLRANSGLTPLASLRAPLESARSPLLDRTAAAPVSPTTPEAARRPAPAASLSARNGAPGAGHFDPIEDDEVAAFRRALHGMAAGGRRGPMPQRIVPAPRCAAAR
ncbi:hypothetical protein [Diaphorobacter aerolatus]|uniref:hypothetical protein n=1 Tax=Diaphorobacter aerolatus TaxID=1288495 RepID=UPI001D013276|nr:hypothetical protein [Diaphorobacter aerolatus]